MTSEQVTSRPGTHTIGAFTFMHTEGTDGAAIYRTDDTYPEKKNEYNNVGIMNGKICIIAKIIKEKIDYT